MADARNSMESIHRNENEICVYVIFGQCRVPYEWIKWMFRMTCGRMLRRNHFHARTWKSKLNITYSVWRLRLQSPTGQIWWHCVGICVIAAMWISESPLWTPHWTHRHIHGRAICVRNAWRRSFSTDSGELFFFFLSKRHFVRTTKLLMWVKITTI